MSKQQRFTFHLSVKEGQEGYDVLHKSEAPIGLSQIKNLETSSSSGAVTMTQQQQNALIAKKRTKAMALATQPGQQILMNAFMMFMSGKHLNIFSISITSMAIMSPLRSIFSLEQTFAQLDGVDLQMPKLIFLGLNLVWFALGMYKMSNMRLLPTTSADWTGSVVWKEMMESSSIPPESFYAN